MNKEELNEILDTFFSLCLLLILITGIIYFITKNIVFKEATIDFTKFLILIILLIISNKLRK